MKHIIAFMFDSADDAQKVFDRVAKEVGRARYVYQALDDQAVKDTFKNAGINIGLALYRHSEKR